MQNEQTEEREPYPEELIAAFSRAQNYPRDLAGITALSQGLRRAADKSGVPMKRIVETCLSVSRFCPTDSELLAIALNLAGPERFEGKGHNPKCPLCEGTGWQRVWAKHTTVTYANGSMGKTKTWITEHEYEDWMRDPEHMKHWKQEMCYQAVRPCKA